MNKFIVVGTIAGCYLFSSMLVAETHPMMSLTLGGDRANLPQTTADVTFIPPFYNSYNGSNHYDTEMLGGLFVGAESDLPANWAWQYGVSYYQNSAFQVHGVVDQFGDPAYANLNYYYQIQSKRYLIETKILYAIKKVYHPYIDLGVGESVNKTYNYLEEGVTSADVPMSQPFANKTTHNFTYLAGVGIDVDLFQHVRLGAGYRYVGLGKAGLNTTPLQVDTNTINNHVIRTNEFFMQLSLIA